MNIVGYMKIDICALTVLVKFIKIYKYIINYVSTTQIP